MLNERKIRILEAVINDYITLAEPIGSRTIAKRYDLGISSATIRNEMSDLEDMGYIVQPHTSAGRIPSDKGYRLYVDNLMQKRHLDKTEKEYISQVIAQNLAHVDELLRSLSNAISYITNYTTITSEPLVKKSKIKYIQLVPIDSKLLVFILVTTLKEVKNQIIRVNPAPSYEQAQIMSNILNAYLEGLAAEDLNQDILKNLQDDFTKNSFDATFLYKLVDILMSALSYGGSVRLFVSGMKNILDFPEFADLQTARTIMNALEEKESILAMLNLEDFKSYPVQVVIGCENKSINLQNCSIIKAKIKIGSIIGSIAIVGPTRMNYSKTLATIQAILDINRSLI